MIWGLTCYLKETLPNLITLGYCDVTKHEHEHYQNFKLKGNGINKKNALQTLNVQGDRMSGNVMPYE